MSRFLVVRCLRCGQPLLARGGQRSKLCTYCGAHLNLAKLRIFAVASSSTEARHIVQAMKRPPQPVVLSQESQKSEA